MAVKYTVVYVTPLQVGESIGQTYREVTGQIIPAINLHISLAASFFLKEGYGEDWLKTQVGAVTFEPISVWTTHFAIFDQGAKHILHIRVEPFEPLLALQKQVARRIHDGAEVDLTAYNARVVPAFAPHISLDYDFTEGETILRKLETARVSVFFEMDKLTVIRMKQEAWEKSWEEI